MVLQLKETFAVQCHNKHARCILGGLALSACVSSQHPRQYIPLVTKELTL